MDLFEYIILHIILIAFPILLWIVYLSYNKNLGRSENNLILDFVLITSLYLTIRFGNTDLKGTLMLLLNLPLLLAYIKQRIPSIVILSVSLALYYHLVYEMNLLYVLLEYASYYLIYLLTKQNKVFMITCLVVIKTLNYISFMVLYYYQEMDGYAAIDLLYSILLIHIIGYLVVYLLNKADDITKYHMNIKELEQDKQIRSSLFKITHEIKNPIAVCKGYLDMYDINNLEHSKKYVPIMREEINRVLILLQDFLYMTKIKMEKDIIDIHMVLEDVMDNFIPIFKEKNLELISDIPLESVYIYGDYNRLTQAFINAIKNSVEALEEKGNGNFLLETRADDKNITIRFQDNGIGIDPETLKRISEPFFTTKKNGTGLGVSLLKEIVEGHSGTVTYQSEVGVGTTVTITLPIKQ